MSSSARFGRLFTRKYSSAALNSHEGGDSSKLWKNLSFFVALPAIGLGILNSYLKKDDDAHKRDEYIPYPYLGILTKNFPWKDGKRSLFWNPHTNPLPGVGYVDE